MRRRTKTSSSYSWPVPELGDRPKADDQHHVVIIGAGIGGLTAGALLAKNGLKVLVVEAHDRPGGYCSCWTRSVARGRDTLTFRFDAGVQDFSGLGDRGPLRNLLRQLGAERRLEWRRVRHFYRHDGLALHVADDPAVLIGDLAQLFPHEARAVADFFTEIEAVYRELYADIELTNGIPMAPQSYEAMIAWPATHPHAWRWMREPFVVMLDAFFADPVLKDLLTTLSEYITDRPDLTTVGEMAPLFGYYLKGGAYPVGGSQTLADLLVAIIEENGGRLRLRTKVRKVLIESGGVAGIETVGGRVERAPLVLANGDVVSMLSDLAGQEHLPAEYAQRIGALRRGPSAILLSLGLDKVPDLPARTFVKQAGLRFGIGNPSAIDPSLASPGHAAVTILYLLSGDEASTWQRKQSLYQDRKAAFAERLIGVTEATVLPGLSRSIVYQEIASPATFTRFARTRNGNIYGAACGQWRPGLRTPVPGMMLVGAGTGSGAGIEAVVVSGMTAANAILQA